MAETIVESELGVNVDEDSTKVDSRRGTEPVSGVYVTGTEAGDVSEKDCDAVRVSEELGVLVSEVEKPWYVLVSVTVQFW